MLSELNRFNSTPEYGTTRVLFTEPELEGRAYLKGKMAELGLAIREDAIGNIYATLPGTNSSLPPVWTGSHADTVLNAGMFDGMAGVIGGLEALRLIKASGDPHKRDITLVLYTSEEPTRFGLGCLGSRAMAGRLSLKEAELLTDKDGKTLPQVLKKLGYDLTAFDSIPIPEGAVHAAVELHIEQSSSLERHGNQVGIVKTICAPTNYDVVVTGVQSHAGGTSMDDRRDAFAAACEISLALEQLARESLSEYTTGTVGKVEVIPGAANVIPGRVEFTIDIRDCDFESKNKLMHKLMARIHEIEQRRGVEVSLKKYNEDIPIKCDENITKIIEKQCQRRGIDYEYLISGAFHDSMMVGLFAPVAMIFVPSRNGISHSPEEWTDFDDIAAGTNVLAGTLFELANQ